MNKNHPTPAQEETAMTSSEGRTVERAMLECAHQYRKAEPVEQMECVRCGFLNSHIRENFLVAALRKAEKREQRLTAAMREHWLVRIECDHEAKRDNPICACSAVFLGWHESVGTAVEAWAQHVEDAALSGPEEGQDA